jgi:predicted GIY-YIG superfamily endonuclease
MSYVWYVYILRSLSHPDQIYTGFTTNLTTRIKHHNAGESLHTAKYLPWKLICYTAFEDKTKAAEFEQFLKTGAGNTFLKKKFL